MLVLGLMLENEYVLDFSQVNEADLARLRAGELIRIKVTGISQDKIRQGITAPRSVGVDRLEVHEQKARAKARERSLEKAVAP